MPLLKTVTLGCKVNQYETEYVRQALARLGWTDAAADQAADLCIVNTCTVTADGDMKSRKLIRQLARQHPAAEIVVMGCYATRAPEEVASLPGVVDVVTDKRRLPDLLARFGLLDVPDGLDTFGSRHRAHVKIQDGCVMGCAYCIIPSCRPELISRPESSILREIQRLVQHGHREIVLTGIHLGLFGLDGVAGKQLSVDRSRQSAADRSPELARSPETSPLVGLLEKICALPGRFRVRLSSLESGEIGPDLVRLMAAYPERICPHVHVSVQSGSDRVLRRMQRRDTAEQIVARCRAVQQAIDRPALTADVIVGFPGETESDFERSCELVQEVGFSKVHVFRYSRREGTAAADMPNQVEGDVKQQRATRLIGLAEECRRRYLESLRGRWLEVLVERVAGASPGRLQGTSERYAPAELPGAARHVGQLVEARAVGLAAGRLQCQRRSA